MTFSNTHLRTWWLGLLPSAQDDVKGVLSAHDLHALDQAFSDGAEDAHAAGRGDVAQLEAERESLRQQLVAAMHPAKSLAIQVDWVCLLCGHRQLARPPLGSEVLCCLADSPKVEVPHAWPSRALPMKWLAGIPEDRLEVVKQARTREDVLDDGTRDIPF